MKTARRSGASRAGGRPFHGKRGERARSGAPAEPSDARLRVLTENLADFIMVVGRDGMIRYNTPNLERFLGEGAGKFVGRDAFRLVHPDDLPLARRLFDELLQKPGATRTAELRLRHRDGSWPYVEVIGKNRLANPAIGGIVLNARDITARKQAEADLQQLNKTLEQRGAERTAALLESEGRFRQMAENVQEVFWLTEANMTRMLYVSPSFETIWGHSCKELHENPRLWLETVHPDDQRRTRAAFFQKRIKGAGLQAEYRIVRPDGSIRWIQDRRAPIRDKNGRVYRVAGMARDITESKATETRLEYLASFPQKNPNPIVEVDLHGGLRYANPAVRALFPELLQQGLAHPWLAEWTTVTQSFQAGRKRIGVRAVTVGERTYQQALHYFPAEQFVRIYGFDITERKRLEAEIQRISEGEKQRLGRDLHDGLNQQLTAVRYLAGALEATLAQKALPEAADAGKIVRELANASRQTHDLARGLFPPLLQKGDIVRALQELAHTTSQLFKISCRVAAARGIHLAEAETARQLYRIAQEAINNASKHSRGRHIWVQLVEKKGRIILTVKDDGVGISKKALERADMGLRIMQYRAGMLNANLIIARAPHGGTLVTCSFARPAANHPPERKP